MNLSIPLFGGKWHVPWAEFQCNYTLLFTRDCITQWNLFPQIILCLGLLAINCLASDYLKFGAGWRGHSHLFTVHFLACHNTCRATLIPAFLNGLKCVLYVMYQRHCDWLYLEDSVCTVVRSYVSPQRRDSDSGRLNHLPAVMQLLKKGTGFGLRPGPRKLCWVSQYCLCCAKKGGHILWQSNFQLSII